MSRTDLISDALTVIRNASRVRKEEAIIPYSSVLMGVLTIFKNEGYVENFKEIDLGNIKKIKVYLKYSGKKSAITQLKKVSRPGRRKYVDRSSIPQVLSGYGTAVVSTSKGIMSGAQAQEAGIGGEVLCYIW